MSKNVTRDVAGEDLDCHKDDGGYAEQIVVPAANAVWIPDNVPFEQAAVMMCSTATAWHALKLARLLRRT